MLLPVGESATVCRLFTLYKHCMEPSRISTSQWHRTRNPLNDRIRLTKVLKRDEDGTGLTQCLSDAVQVTVVPVVVDEKAKDVLRMVLSPRGSYVQQLLVDELVWHMAPASL